jgi:ubiquinone/menaquinone biosynthesis C-methylase UbiE
MNSTATQNISSEANSVDLTAEHRALIRKEELKLVLPYLKPGMSVLEIGAGAGWQAKILSDRGLNVTAIDIGASNYNNLRVFPVQVYDGVNIPLPDESVDVVFSSNVLEHVPHIEQFQKEMQRVLRPHGTSIHIMPTATWRFWTSLSFYIKRIKQLCTKALQKKPSNKSKAGIKVISIEDYKGAPKSGMINKIKRVVVPALHGVRGNIISEFYYFSRAYWTNMLRASGWKIERVFPNGLLYSGNRILGEKLSMQSRKLLSKLFGSSCMIYVMRRR